MPQRGAIAADSLVRRACLVKRTADGAIAADTTNLYYVAMSAAIHDPGGWFDATNGDIVLPAAGVYLIFANAGFAGGSGGRQLQVHLNPTVPPPASVSVATSMHAISEANAVMPTNGAPGQVTMLQTRRLAAGSRLRMALMSSAATTVKADSTTYCTRMGAVLLMP